MYDEAENEPIAKLSPIHLRVTGTSLGTIGWRALANSGVPDGGVPMKAYGGVVSPYEPEEEEADGVR